MEYIDMEETKNTEGISFFLNCSFIYIAKSPTNTETYLLLESYEDFRFLPIKRGRKEDDDDWQASVINNNTRKKRRKALTITIFLFGSTIYTTKYHNISSTTFDVNNLPKQGVECVILNMIYRVYIYIYICI